MTLFLFLVCAGIGAVHAFAAGSGTADDPYLVATAEDLNAIRDDLAAHYRQTADLDLGAATWSQGEGWMPLGTSDAPFTGLFDGAGYAIRNLTITRPTAERQGLFGYAEEASIHDVTLRDFSVNGLWQVGGIVGGAGFCDLQDLRGNGTIVGTENDVGGLVGALHGGTLDHAEADVVVRGSKDHTGGVVGSTNAYATISRASALGEVYGSGYVGGLVGSLLYGQLTDSFSRAEVNGTVKSGGLVGSIYAGQIYRSYSAGPVTCTSHCGGLVGNVNYQTVQDSYWDTETSGWATGIVGAARTTAQMVVYPYDSDTYLGWDFNTVWMADSTGDNDGYPVLVSPIFKTTATYLLTVGKLGNGKGTVASDPPGIDCGSDCTENYDSGTQVTLTAEPDGLSAFQKWTGACIGSGPCTLTLDAAKRVNATFVKSPTAHLEVAIDGRGKVTSNPPGIDCGSDCGHDYLRNTQVTLTATPVADYRFTGWSGQGCTGTQPTCTLTLDLPKKVEAHFAPNRPVKLSVKVTGYGTVTSDPPGIACGVDCEEPYARGSTVTLTAVPEIGHRFLRWSGDIGNCTGTKPCTVRMDKAKTVEAIFQKVANKLLIVTVTGKGTVTSVEPEGGIACPGDCKESYPAGTPVTLAAVPKLGWEFTGWIGAGFSCKGTGACLVNMSQPLIVKARFEQASAN